ncbi:MAG: hypothetical protein WC732_08125 [Candidatus Omnitrophota bacterium]
MCKAVLIFSAMLLTGCASLDPFYKSPEQIQARKDAFFQTNPKLSKETKDCIQKSEIMVGMTREQVRASWGDPEPYRGSSTVYDDGTSEFWYYRAGYPYEYTLHFINGKLDSFTKDRSADSY